MRSSIIALVLVAVACGSRLNEASDSFSYMYSCPRVEGRRREDIRASEGEPRERPPAAIAADRERLAMWRHRERRDRAIANALDEIYEVDGCGIGRLYACHHARYGVRCDELHPADPAVDDTDEVIEAGEKALNDYSGIEEQIEQIEQMNQPSR